MEKGNDGVFLKKGPISEIEKTANYEGNHTLLLEERIHNPVIKQRLVDNFYEHLSTLTADAFLQADNYTRTIRQAERARKKFLETLTKEKIAQDFESLAKDVFSATNISYEKNPTQPADSEGLGSRGTVYLLALDDDGKYVSVKQKSMYEAHEKGHGIRMFYGESDFVNRIKSAFDFSAITKETAEKYRELVRRAHNEIQRGTREDPLKYFESAHEIFERMSQLKNYFGMNGDQVFTKEHLAYARSHYVEDMGFSLQMLPFLEAITPEKEDEFIELMNTLGV